MSKEKFYKRVETSSDQPGNVRTRGAPTPPLEEAQGNENESSRPSSALQGSALHSKEPSVKEGRMWGDCSGLRLRMHAHLLTTEPGFQET